MRPHHSVGGSDYSFRLLPKLADGRSYEPAPHWPSATDRTGDLRRFTWNKLPSQKQEDSFFNIPTMRERAEKSTVKRSANDNNNNNTSWLSLNTYTSSHPGKGLPVLLGTKEMLKISVELNSAGINVQLGRSSHDYIWQWTLTNTVFDDA